MIDNRSRAYARFCLNIISEIGPYCACDLKEGWLRAWQGTELPHNAYWKLATGNKDERNLFYLMCETQAENAPSVEIRLTGKEIDSIKNFLDGVYEDDRDETDSYITADGWDSYFYLEFDDGTPPLSIKTYLSYSAFADKMYCFLYQRFELWEPTDFSYVKWDKKRPAEAERQLVQDALEAGIDAVYYLLYGGKAVPRIAPGHICVYHSPYSQKSCVGHGAYADATPPSDKRKAVPSIHPLNDLRC